MGTFITTFSVKKPQPSLPPSFPATREQAKFQPKPTKVPLKQANIIFLKQEEARERGITITENATEREPTASEKAIAFAEDVTRTKKGTSGAVGVKPRVRKKDFGIERPQLSVIKSVLAEKPVIRELVAVEKATNIKKQIEEEGGKVITGYPLPIIPMGSIATLGKSTLFFAGQTQRVSSAGGFTRTAFTTAKGEKGIAQSAKGEKGIAQSFTLFGKEKGVDVGLTLTTGGRVQKVISATGKEQQVFSKPFIAGELFQTQKAGTSIKQIGAGRTFFIKGGKLKGGKDFISVGKAGELDSRIFSSGGIFQKGGGVARQSGVLDVIGKQARGGTINTGNLKTFQSSTATQRATLSAQQTIASAQPTVTKVITPISKSITIPSLTASGIKTISQLSPKQKASPQTKVTTIFKQPSISKTLQSQGSVFVLKSLTQQKAIQSVKSAQATQQKVIQTLAPKLMSKARTTQAVKLASLQIPKSIGVLKFTGATKPFTPIPTIPKTPFFVPFKLKPSKPLARRGGLFGVAVRRFGKFKTIGAGLSISKAIEVGRGRVARTLGATFKIIPAGKGFSPTGIRTPKGFKRKKGLTFIEAPRLRLSTGTETKEIQLAKSIASQGSIKT